MCAKVHAIPLLLLVVSLGHPVETHAQEAPPPRSATATLGLFQYDLPSTGLTPMLALRAATPINTALMLEGSLVGARPEHNGRASILLIPEVQLQIAVPFTGVVPHMGLGIGSAFDFRPAEAGGTQVDLTVSGALGVRTRIGDRFGLIAEFRGRGIGMDFEGTSSEYTVGLNWHL